MSNLANDPTKDIVLFVNNFRPEYANALKKLSTRLGRPLRGIILLDKEIKEKEYNDKDTEGVFEEILCDFSDETALRKALKKLEPTLLLVTAAGEWNQPYFQRVLPHVPYALGPTERSLDWATHKAKMREMLGSYNGALVPKVQEMTSGSEEEIQKALDRLQFPVIAKPTGLATSMLVTKAHDEAELRKILQKSFAMLAKVYKRNRGRGKPSMIIEEFIEGNMYTVDAYVNQVGKVWQLPLLRARTGYAAGLTGFNIYKEDSYLGLTPEEDAAGHEAAEQAIHALELRSSVAHIELYHTKDGWKIIELGARPGGQRQDIYDAAYKIDHAYNELLLKADLEPEITHELAMHVTTFNLYVDKEGILRDIEGLDEVRKVPSLYKLDILPPPNNIALHSDNGGMPIARGVLHHTDLDTVNKDGEYVRSIIKFVTDPLPEDIAREYRNDEN